MLFNIDKTKTMCKFSAYVCSYAVGVFSAAELKSQITEAFMNINKKPQWGQQLMQMGILGYTKVDESSYALEDEVLALVKNMTITPAYY